MNAEGKKKAKGGKGGVQLFQPMTLRGVTMRNRIWLPPMDTYSAVARDGKPTPFHYQHYVSRAMGGFGMIIAEATAVTADGRISPRDVGLWNDDQVAAWHWIVDGIKQAGAVAAVQLNHAGRKGSTGCFGVGFEGKSVPEDAGGWRTVAPSPIAYRGLTDPRALSVEEIHGLVSAFRDAAQRAVRAGFEAIEIHAAHGYLISQFLDPLCNERADEYGGDIHGRMRFLLEVADAIREVIPDTVPLLVRISATDWAAGGAGLADSKEQPWDWAFAACRNASAAGFCTTWETPHTSCWRQRSSPSISRPSPNLGHPPWWPGAMRPRWPRWRLPCSCRFWAAWPI